MQVCLFVPASVAAPYSRSLAIALRAQGYNVQVADLAGRFPEPDEIAIDAIRAAWATMPTGTLALIDDSAAPACDGLALNTAVGLIHRTDALEIAAPWQHFGHLIVTNDQTAHRLTNRPGLTDARVSVLEPGVGDLPRSRGSDGPGCAILSVGALIQRKGHAVLLHALARLFDLDWHLTIAGSAAIDPVHAASLHALTDSLGIAGRVTFQDAVTDDLWLGADLFALTSNAEDYGAVIAEALRRGVPVAVTSVGAVPGLVAPEAGVICAPGDVEQMSKAIRRLIFDPALRRDMAEVAWTSGQALPTWADQAAKLAALLAG